MLTAYALMFFDCSLMFFASALAFTWSEEPLNVNMNVLSDIAIAFAECNYTSNYPSFAIVH